MKWYPKRGHLSFWLAVGHRVKARGVKHKDRARIMQIIEEVETEWRKYEHIQNER